MNTKFSRTILLLGGSLGSSDDGGVPEDERFPSRAADEADLRVEEAVVALVRGCLTRNCRLAMWNDPILTPLVIEVALEYWESLPGEERGFEGRRFSAAPVTVYGDGLEEEESEVLHYYAQIGCIQLLREFDPIETFIDRIVYIGGSIASMDLLRTVERRSGRQVPVYPIASTGGVARSLYQTREVVELEGRIAKKIADLQRQAKFDPPHAEPSRGFFVGEQRVTDPERDAIPQFQAALYPIIVSEILDEEINSPARAQRETSM
jgi:hypothetical protein